MKKLGATKKKGLLRRAMSALLALVMLAGMLPASLPTAQAGWADKYVEKLVEWGVMRGDGSGNYNADANITRAEFVAMVNRAFGYDTATAHPFTDVRVQDWFNDDIGMAYNMGYFKGVSGTLAAPNGSLTREQAVILIGRNLLLDEKRGENLSFSDSRDFSDWSRGMVESAISAGYAGGYSDGSFKPQKLITRGEVAAMLVKAIGTMVNRPGTHTLGGVYGNVMISSSGVALKDTVIAGNLYITGGLELGDILLENVTVLGKIIVSGAGESNKGDSSVILRNVECGELVVDSLKGQYVSLRAEGNTQIDLADIRTSAYIEDRTEVGDGLLNIEMNGQMGMNLTLAGNIEEVVNCTGGSILTIAQGTAQVVTIDEKAVDSILDIKNIATVLNLNLDVGTNVTGEGDVKNITISAAGTVVDPLPDKIDIRPGLTADVNGETMDTKDGEESSAEPRILAGYPKIKNIAPTSAEAVFSTNKKGTIYWALTSLISGPVSADDLIEAKDYDTKILQRGTINVSASEQEVKVKISKLIADGSYYVSAVLVDSRGQQSPVKYALFTTPDGTPPAFASGYPDLVQVTMNNAQVTVMPTKSSVLYYAVLPKGASAPTIDEFKAHAVSGDLGSCPAEGIEVEKNYITLRNIAGNDIKNGDLEELKSYELYLCLIDPDNGRDSGVRRISFTTIDGTPPILADAMVTGIQKTSVNLTTSMNEDGTIYWVVVREGQTYPVPSTGSGTVDDDTAAIQVINGMGNVIKAGKSNAKTNSDVVLKVSGLEAESSYDVYYVAVDKAGNHSVVKKITVNTLDDVRPTARQEFTKTTDEAGLNPLPETDIKIIFSESVRSNASDSTFYQLYQDSKDEKLSEEKRNLAKSELAAELAASIQLYDISNISAEYLIGDEKTEGAWIDYSQVKIEMNDDGELVVTFESGTAISLGSGSTYEFRLIDITDTSNARNFMRPNPTVLDKFTTVFAQVNLTTQVSNNASVSGEPLKWDRDMTMNPDEKAHMDMRFWLSPQSTSSVNSNVYYDIWFEATNTIVRFDLYVRVIDPSKTGKEKIVTDRNAFSMFKDSGHTIDPDTGWLYLDKMEVGEFNGTMCSSVNYAISGPNQTTQLNTLNEKYVYEFALEVRHIDLSSDRESWSEEVELKVYVPAGQGVSSSTFVQQNRNQVMDKNDDVKNIAKPSPFVINHPFIATKVPVFVSAKPAFNAGDSMVNIDVMLDRPGEIHYVVMPMTDMEGNLLPSILTEIEVDKEFLEDYPALVADKGLKQGDTLSYEAFYKYLTDNGKDPWPPTSGGSIGPNDTMRNWYKLASPTVERIQQLASMNGGVENPPQDVVKVEGGKADQIKIEGLDPTTTYFAFLVLEGESGQKSDVYVFSFTTVEVDTPVIELNLTESGTVVDLKTSTNADVYWAMYTYDMFAKIYPNDDKFAGTAGAAGKPGYLDPALKDKFAAACTNLGLVASDVTVIQALTAIVIDPNDLHGRAPGSSLFDIFANETIRKEVEEHIRIEATTTFEPDEYGKTEEGDPLEQGKIMEIKPEFKTDATYYLIAVAKNPLGDSYGFKAIGGLHRADDVGPVLDHFSASVATYAATILPNGKFGPYEVSKEVYQEDPEMYAFQVTVELRFSEKIYRQIMGSDYVKKLDPVTSTNFVGLISRPSETAIRNVSVTEGGMITFTVYNISHGQTITLFNEGVISDAYNNPPEDGSLLVLTFSVWKEKDPDDKLGVDVVLPHMSYSWSGSKPKNTLSAVRHPHLEMVAI